MGSEIASDTRTCSGGLARPWQGPPGHWPGWGAAPPLSVETGPLGAFHKWVWSVAEGAGMLVSAPGLFTTAFVVAPPDFQRFGRGARVGEGQ